METNFPTSLFNVSLKGHTLYTEVMTSQNLNVKVKQSHNTPTEALGGRGGIGPTHSRPRH
jgi:hypothetical protein